MQEFYKKIRYRDGRINGYTSRLHYIADWINNGVKHGFMEDVTAANSPDSIALSLNFMSSHPKSYRQLASSPENVSKIESIEKALSGQTFHYIPKAKLPDEGFSWIKNGDIIAITTNVPGLDVAHMGIAYYEKGSIEIAPCFFHPENGGYYAKTLAQMLKNNKRFTGIRVVRMK